MSTVQQIVTPGLTYDDITHTYRLNGVRIRSVTRIIQAAGIVDGLEFMTEEHRKRGSDVHTAIHYLHENDLDWSTVTPALHGYLKAHQRFWAEMHPKAPWSELHMAHPIMKYGMTPDLPVCILHGEPVVIDYKTGAYAPHQAVQLAAYVEGVKANAQWLGLKPSETPERGLVVCLDKDGGYQIHDPRTERKPMRHIQAWATFLDGLNLYMWKEKYLNGNANVSPNLPWD